MFAARESLTVMKLETVFKKQKNYASTIVVQLVQTKRTVEIRQRLT